MTVIDALRQRGPVSPEPPLPIAPHELLGQVAYWEEPGDYGFDRCSAHLVRGLCDRKLRLLVRCEWEPAVGYSASGTQEELLELPLADDVALDV